MLLLLLLLLLPSLTGRSKNGPKDCLAPLTTVRKTPEPTPPISFNRKEQDQEYDQEQEVGGIRRHNLLSCIHRGLHFGLDLGVERFIRLQRLFRSIATLRELRSLVADPGSSLLENIVFNREIEQRAGG